MEIAAVGLDYSKYERFMNSSKLIRSIFLLLFTVVGSASAFAQDSTSLTVDHSQTAGWNFSMTDANPAKTQIREIALQIQTPGIIFIGATTSGTASDWTGTTPVGSDTTQATYENPTTWMSFGQTLSTFSFALGIPDSAYDQPITIQWKTLSNTLATITTGYWTVIPTVFQSFTSLDKVTLTSSLLPNGDPGFTFDVKSSNSSNYAIKALSLQILGATRGLFRPLDVQAASGWTLDSVRPYVVYFHTDGQGILPGHDVSGFNVGLRSDQSPKVFSFVWRAFNTSNLAESGSFIDRDTVSSGSITPGSTSIATNNDSVTVANTAKQCTFNALVGNYHISNLKPPSPIDRVILNITTPGVTFKTATPPTSDWAKAISADSRSVTFATEDPLGLAGGKIGTFGASVDNPSGNNFTINWLAIGSLLDTIDAGSFSDSCAVPPPVNDVVTLTNIGSCNFKMTVTNQHGPTTSALHGVSVSIASSDGGFTTGSGSTTQPKWGVGAVGAPQSLIYLDSVTTSDIPVGQKVDIFFSVSAKNAANSVPIAWQTYDVADGFTAISKGSVTAASCTIAAACDSVRLAPTPNFCTDTFTVWNKRGTGKSVTSLVVTAQDGRTIPIAAANIGWNIAYSPDHTSVTFTSSTGISDGTQTTNFVVSFNTPGGPFGIQIVTTDVDQNACTKNATLNCATSGVARDEALRMTTLSVSPNPFSGRTDISFTLAERDHANVVLLDVLGRVQENVLDASLDTGNHSVTLDGSSLRPGTYYLRLETSAGRVTKKLVVNK